MSSVPSGPGEATSADRARWFAQEVHSHEAAVRGYLRIQFPSLDADEVLQLAFAWSVAVFQGRGAEMPSKCAFELPPGAAENPLKAFSEQSGRSLIVAASVAAGVQTKGVRGEFTPQEPLEQMLDGTGLVAVEDRTSGAFSVRRAKGHGSSKAGGAPSNDAKSSPHFPLRL